MLESDPTFSKKSMKEQFEGAHFPACTQRWGHTPTHISNLVIVIDALNECEREGDIRNILHLLSRTRHLGSVYIRISQVRLASRTFFTSVVSMTSDKSKWWINPVD